MKGESNQPFDAVKREDCSMCLHQNDHHQAEFE
jgi:hypothetical protein